MAWIVENGRVIEGGLAPVFTIDELRNGMEVQIVRGHGRKLSRAVIERAHEVSTNGQQGSVYRHLCTSSDGGEVTKECEVFRSCVHVRYRNNVRAVVDCLAFIRPLDSAVEQLAKLVEDDEVEQET